MMMKMKMCVCVCDEGGVIKLYNATFDIKMLYLSACSQFLELHVIINDYICQQQVAAGCMSKRRVGITQHQLLVFSSRSHHRKIAHAAQEVAVCTRTI